VEFKDYYKVLGIDSKATADEIKNAYRKLARQFHPDVNPGNKEAEERFKQITEAYEVLGNDENRRRYDQLGANWKMYSQQQANPFGHGASSPFGNYRTYRSQRQASPRGADSPFDFDDMFGGFSDFFRTFFGSEAEELQSSNQPRSHRAVLTITLGEAYTGVKKQLHFGQQKFNLTIKPGVADDQVLRLPGLVDPMQPGQPKEDLYLRIRIQPHPIFDRKGNDLYLTKTLPYTTAALGGQLDIQMPDGSNLRINVPAGSQSGAVLRARERGMPLYNQPDHRGDLHVKLKVEVPRQLTDEQRHLLEQLAKTGL
jgi:curved DNA-binding protein